MNVALRCRCGRLQGELSSPASGCRAVCYCRDCQAFARYLGEPERKLDAEGGTEVIATVPKHVRLITGAEQLACMSLTPNGLYRWYARCCRTPIANTPRDPKTSYVGIPMQCLSLGASERDRIFGTARVMVNTGSATSPVKSAGLTNLLGILRIMRNLVGARLFGGWRRNPFFRAGGSEPISAPEQIDAERRRALRDA